MAPHRHTPMHALTLHRASITSIIVVAPAVALPWWLQEAWWLELALVATLVIATAAVTTDLVDARVPDRVVIGAVMPVLLVVGLQVASGDAGAAVLGVLLGAALFAGPLLIVHLAAPSAIGFGDVKLAAALGAAVGLVEWRSALLGLCLASAATAVVAIARRRPSMPFAPGLVGGAALALLPLTTEGSLPWR